MEPTTPAGRVLLVDDSALIRALVSDALRDDGWGVTVAGNGTEALMVYATSSPEVVVCDLHMPDMTGFDVMNQIHEHNPDVPVIILSSDEDLSAVLGAVRRGAFDYVVKSDTGPLLASVRKATDHHRMVLENRRLVRELAEARDEALEASKAKGAFLANMTHELRTPLNAILSYTDLLLEDAEDMGEDQFVKDLGRIRQAGRKLKSLINDVLDLAKIESGRLHFNIEDVDCAALVDDIRGTVEPLARDNGNRFLVDIQVPSVQTDPRKLWQCLINLLGNAAKFTENGEVELTIRPDGDDVVFRVRDTGIGMTEEAAAGIFDEFVQVDGSNTRKYGGTGLGLAITQRLCEALKGTISVASQPGVGTTFTMRMPRRGWGTIE